MPGGEHWDCVVIGAGIGGLTAAGILAEAGERVLVLERRAYVGGTATTYSLRGFGFPRGPLGFGTPAVVEDALGKMGDWDALPLHRVRYAMRASGLDVPLSVPSPELTSILSRMFPGDARGIERFFRVGQQLADELRAARQEGRPARIAPELDVLASAWLEENVADPVLRRLLGSMGSHEPVFGLPLLAAMWDLMCDVGIYYPEEGLNGLCERFAGLREGEGRARPDIRLGRGVQSVAVRDGRVAGVVLEDGDTVGAGAVISNADFKNTFLGLVAPGDLPDEWRSAVARAGQTGSVLQVGVGLETDRAALDAFEEAGRIIYRREGAEGSLPPAWDQPEVDPDALARQELELALTSADDRRLAPPGHALLVIRTAADYRHFARFADGRSGRKDGYSGYKLRLARALVTEAERLVPGLGNAVRILDVSTPITFENEDSRYEGAVAGWSQTWGSSGNHQRRELILTPVQGLYMAGYQAFTHMYPGGVPSAVESGIRAARAVLEAVGPVEEVTIPTA